MQLAVSILILIILADVWRRLIAINKKEDSLMIDVSALTAQVAAETTVEQSAITLINGLAASQSTLAQQLKDALAAEDPAAIAAAQKAIDDSVAQMKASSAALAAAVTANTPASA